MIMDDLELYSDLLEKAINIAIYGHARQKDSLGNPYILHPLKVMMSMRTHKEKIVAILHDLIEDTNFTIDDLKKLGFPEDIRIALDFLTHKNYDNYENYIEKITHNDLALKVKIADLEDNLDFKRIHNTTDLDLEKFNEFHYYYNILINK